MRAIFLFLPILLIRYGLLGAINQGALKRAAHFAPLVGREPIAYWIYQLSTLSIFVYLFVLDIKMDSSWFLPGIITYGIGIVLYAIAVIHYARPEADGLNTRGLYNVSRNPMYVAYFLCLLGCAMLTASWMVLMLVLLFQIASHFIIRSEERWCLKQFGETYAAYMKKVGRYL